MRTHQLLALSFSVGLCLGGCTSAPTASENDQSATDQVTNNTPEPPNIILIVADDLGYGDLGSYGQQQIQTPSLDRMASEGMRFTQFYAGSTVCAPSRSVLMTGQDTGHTRVRGNAGGETLKQSLRDEDVTLAEIARQADYQTVLIGKWGLGEINEPGFPLEQGFDQFFGYLNQVHAHNYYPEFLWRNRDSVRLGNVVQRSEKPYSSFVGGYATKKVDYSHDLFMEEALAFVEQNQQDRFFLCLTLTIPHANNEAGRQGMEVSQANTAHYQQYANKDWPEVQKKGAAMISHLDSDMGRLLRALQEYGIDENTLVLFTSDNGPHQEGGYDPAFFDANGPLRGIKRALYEGGIRVPLIARWPGHVPAGTTSNHISYFGDMMATFADLMDVPAPDSLQSISMVPTLLGNPDEQRPHNYLYWEFYEQGSRQAVRMGNWKGIRQPMFTGPMELYNLETDLGEENNVAEENTEVVAEMERMMERAHQPSPLWVVAQQAGD